MKDKKQSIVMFMGVLIAMASLFLISSGARAASYPEKNIKFIVPYSPGGGVDTVARMIGSKLSERLGKQVVVENRGGAATIVGTEVASKAAPDGYTFLLVATAFTTNPALQKLPYDTLKDFTPVARIATGTNALFVHPSVPANTVKEFIALAKEKPGKLVFASGGIGGGTHMSEELFEIMTGTDLKIVQFKGTGPALTDLLGGHSDATIGMLFLAAPHIRAGKLKVLGTSGTKRSLIMPDVPTIAEAGVPGYSSMGWYGLVAPAGTPPSIVERLSKEIKEILDTEEIQKAFLSQGAEVDYLNPKEFGQYLEEEINKWADVVKKANIKVER